MEAQTGIALLKSPLSPAALITVAVFSAWLSERPLPLSFTLSAARTGHRHAHSHFAHEEINSRDFPVHHRPFSKF